MMAAFAVPNHPEPQIPRRPTTRPEGKALNRSMSLTQASSTAPPRSTLDLESVTGLQTTPREQRAARLPRNKAPQSPPVSPRMPRSPRAPVSQSHQQYPQEDPQKEEKLDRDTKRSAYVVDDISSEDSEDEENGSGFIKYFQPPDLSSTSSEGCEGEYVASKAKGSDSDSDGKSVDGYTVGRVGSTGESSSESESSHETKGGRGYIVSAKSKRKATKVDKENKPNPKRSTNESVPAKGIPPGFASLPSSCMPLKRYSPSAAKVIKMEGEEIFHKFFAQEEIERSNTSDKEEFLFHTPQPPRPSHTSHLPFRGQSTASMPPVSSSPMVSSLLRSSSTPPPYPTSYVKLNVAWITTKKALKRESSEDNSDDYEEYDDFEFDSIVASGPNREPLKTPGKSLLNRQESGSSTKHQPTQISQQPPPRPSTAQPPRVPSRPSSLHLGRYDSGEDTNYYNSDINNSSPSRSSNLDKPNTIHSNLMTFNSEKRASGLLRPRVPERPLSLTIDGTPNLKMDAPTSQIKSDQHLGYSYSGSSLPSSDFAYYNVDINQEEENMTNINKRFQDVAMFVKTMPTHIPPRKLTELHFRSLEDFERTNRQ